MIKRFVQLILDRASARRVENEIRASGKRTEKAWVKNWTNIRRAALAALGAATTAAAALVKLTKRGGEVLNLERAFNRITGFQVGAIERLTEASSGLVSQAELMRQANTALTLGSADTVEQFAELARTAQQLGRALGLDAAFAINSLNIGIARQSRLVLDNLGIIVSAEEANRKYAAALGIASSALTDVQKKEAFRIEALEQARQKTEELGGITLNAADTFQQLQVDIANATDRLSTWIAESGKMQRVWTQLRAMVRTGAIGGPAVHAEITRLEGEREQARLAGAGRFLPGRAAPQFDMAALREQHAAQQGIADAFLKSHQELRDFNLELEILNNRIVEINEPVLEPFLGRALKVGDALHLTGASVTTMADKWLPQLDTSLQDATVSWRAYEVAADDAKNKNEEFSESLSDVLQKLGAAGGLFSVLSRFIPGLGGLNPFGIATSVIGNFAGLFQHGGVIPPGQWGIVGENGPELAFAGRGGMAVSPTGITVNVSPGRVPSDWWRDQDWMRGIENANRELHNRGFRFE